MRFVLYEQFVRNWYRKLKFRTIGQHFSYQEGQCLVFENRSII
jgi:hypothetical protein